jgi:hypothetical protein
MGEPTRYVTTSSGMTTGMQEVKEVTTITEQIAVPIQASTQTFTSGIAPGSSLATPCHPVTGATSHMNAIPVGRTTTAFPDMTTYEQTTGLPTTTHMYGVPLATFEKTGHTKASPAIPLSTATTGAITGAPFTTTTVESHIMPLTDPMGVPLMQQSQTMVSDSYQPVNTAPTANLAGVPGGAALGAAGIHHHDRAHHHHVHDRVPPGGLSGTAAPAKALTNEHQLVQDVLPPGRNKVVEHHEKF